MKKRFVVFTMLGLMFSPAVIAAGGELSGRELRERPTFEGARCGGTQMMKKNVSEARVLASHTEQSSDQSAKLAE